MNKKLLAEEVIAYLLQHEATNASDFALKKHPFGTISSKELTQQLVGFQKSKKKLPTWYTTKNILFPPKINLEQTSSENTAMYKASLVSGENMIDITGGFGIDSYFFSKKVSHLFYCELNSDLQQLAHHNFKALGVSNIDSKCINGIEVLKQNSHLDWVFIDPSRRSNTKGKVFLLKDCLPNVSAMMPFIFNHSKNVLIKTAPIFDITQGFRELQHIKEVHIVAIENEVKELLWVLEKGFTGEVTYVCASLEKERNHIYKISDNELKTAKASFGTLSNYLYEPYAVFMKLGGFNWVSSYFKLEKLQEMSHLYTSKQLVEFPGKRFNVIQTYAYNKQAIKELSGGKASVVTRNFKLTVSMLRKKMKLKEDDMRFLFFTTDITGKQIIVDCERIF